MKVFVLGLDGATFDLILPWVDEGRLPNMARLMRNGTWGRLDSVPNMRSAAAWTSFMTGTNPGKHGIFEFYEYQHDYQTKFLQGGHREGPTLWRILSDTGKRPVVINVPMTYPAEPLNGLLVAGLDAPGPNSRRFTHPPELIREIEGGFGEYILEPGLTGLIVDGRLDEAASRLAEELIQKIEICRHYLKAAEWDLFVMVFRSLDAAQHCFWKYMDSTHPQHDPSIADKYGDVIYDFYRRIDEFVPTVESALGDDDLLLMMSDHGCGMKHPAGNQLNQWLAEQGFLKYREGETASVLGTIYRFIQGKTSRRVKERLVKYFPALRDKIQSRLCFANMDWPSTCAYGDGLFPNIWINLRGREPEGTVEPGSDYERIVQDLKQRLFQCRDDSSGEVIVGEVFEKSEIYKGKYVDKAPDLLVRWREDVPINGIKLSSPPLHESASPLPAEDYRIISGDHRFQGIFLASGKNVRKGVEIEGPSILDLAPTILHAFDLPIPRDMDGEVLQDIFDENDRRPPRFVEGAPGADKDEVSYSGEEEESIRERLKGLGYLD